MADLIQKQYSLKIKAINDDGTFEGYASVFGNVDSDGEVIDKGAFKRTLDHNKGIVPIFWQHDKTQPVGWNTEATEDNYGLLVKGRLLMEAEKGRYAHSFVKTGLDVGGKPGLSIGFCVTRGGDYVKDGVRHFKEIALKEYSIVSFAANDLASVTVAKFQKHLDMRKKVDMTKQAQDFNSSLAIQQVMDALYEEKYTMQSALYDALDDICEDEMLTIDEKKLQITKSFGQFATAMSDWWGRFLDATADDPEAADDAAEGKGEKAGRAISAGTAAQLEKAAGHLSDSTGYAKMAGASRMKAVGVLAALKKVYYANDVNAPNPVGGGKEESDPEILHSLLKASRAVKAMR